MPRFPQPLRRRSLRLLYKGVRTTSPRLRPEKAKVNVGGRHPERAQLYWFDRIWRILCAKVGRTLWYSRRGRRESYRGPPREGREGGVRPGKVVRHWGKPRWIPHRPP